MNIKFGMPTLIELSTIEDCVKLCKELNFDFIELNMNMPQYQVEELDVCMLKRIMHEENIFFTIHLDENLNVCDFNKRISKAYIDTVLSTIEIAKEVQIPLLNMHMADGVYFTLPGKKVYLFEQFKGDFINSLISFREQCIKAISSYNIKICIENANGNKNFAIKGIETLLESDVFALTFDIGHSFTSNNVDEDFIMRNVSKLMHMHIHDAKGRNNHLVLGTGEIDIKAKLALAEKQSCRCVLETKTVEGLRQSVNYLRVVLGVSI